MDTVAVFLRLHCLCGSFVSKLIFGVRDSIQLKLWGLVLGLPRIGHKVYLSIHCSGTSCLLAGHMLSTDCITSVLKHFV